MRCWWKLTWACAFDGRLIDKDVMSASMLVSAHVFFRDPLRDFDIGSFFAFFHLDSSLPVNLWTRPLPPSYLRHITYRGAEVPVG